MPTANTSARLAVLGLATVGAIALAAQPGCDSLSTCHPSSRSAGETILSSWCQRYTQCDATRGTITECVNTRLSIGQVPSADGCAATCAEDSGCRRSSCDEAKIDKCKSDALAMKCDEQVSNSLVRFPLGCDTCFNN